MTSETWANLKLTLSNNRIFSFDITYEDFKNKSLLEIFIENVPMIPTSSIPRMSAPQTQKTSAEVTVLKIPLRAEIKNYIISQPNYKFSFENIVQFFSGNKQLNTNDPDVIRWMNSVRMKTKRVREEIAEKENGHWTDEYDGRSKIFTFVKDSGGE